MNLSNADFGGINKLHEIAYGAKRRPVFMIPYYQRPYEWKKEHIDNLITDFIKNKSGGTSPEYFVGATVLVTKEKKELEVVDGQQRVTTMYLLNMLRFFLQRALVDYDLKSSRYVTDVSKDLSELVKTYNDLIGDIHVSDIQTMVETIIEKIASWSDALSEGKVEEGKNALLDATEVYSTSMGISLKATSDLDYLQDCQILSEQFWKNENLSLCYSRDSFTNKLKEALSKIVIVLDSTGKALFKLEIDDINSIKQNDEIVGQYVESMYFEFKAISDVVDKKGVTGRNWTSSAIKLIEEMVDKIEFCAVVTGDEKDAYALFESLNDRNKAVDDLDLIKNLYLRAYYNKSGDSGAVRERGLDKIDAIWNDAIFTKENRALISLLGAVFLTGNTSIDEKNGLGVRKAIDAYLEKKTVYSLQDVCNDIKIYKMIREIINTSTKSGMNLNKGLLIAENDTSLSCTYKCLYLIKALGYPNVLSGLANVIMATYLSGKTGDINIDDFKNSFLGGLMQSSQETDPKYKDIHEIAYDLWRVTMAAEDYKTPREYATVIIQAYNKNSADKTRAALSNYLFTNAQSEFDKWLVAWRYNTKNKDIRIKVMFIRLLRTSKDSTMRELTLNAATAISLTKPELSELDHLEPADPDKSFVEEAYFKAPAGKTRNEIVDGLGNFMLLDDRDNIKKSNCPLSKAMDYYDTMLKGKTHWLVEEIKTEISDDAWFEDVSGNRVPTENFFTNRRSRLINYFKAITAAPTLNSTTTKY